MLCSLAPFLPSLQLQQATCLVRPGCNTCGWSKAGLLWQRGTQDCFPVPHQGVAPLQLPKVTGLCGFCLSSICSFFFWHRNPFFPPSRAHARRARGPGGRLGWELPWPMMVWDGHTTRPNRQSIPSPRLWSRFMGRHVTWMGHQIQFPGHLFQLLRWRLSSCSGQGGLLH